MSYTYFLPPDPPLLDRFDDHFMMPETADDMQEMIFAHLLLLLNTRSVWSSGELPSPLDCTVLGWGMPDQGPLATHSVSDRFRLRQMIARAITAFEPRIEGVQVEDGQTPDGNHRPVFHIRARIRLPDGVIDISRDTVLDIASRRFERRKRGLAR